MPEISVETLYSIAFAAARVGVIFLVAVVATGIVSKLIRRMRTNIAEIMSKRSEESRSAIGKRAETIGGVLRKTAAITIWTMALFMALREMGFDIGPLLAGAGIVGLAVGFGAQNLVRDVISGMFMLLENQVRVGDVAVINGTGGLVEEINLRTTVSRGLDGTVHVFPNGAIQTMSNLTKGYSCYVFDIGVAYKEDTDRVTEAIREVDEHLRTDSEFGPKILAPLEIFGVDEFADSAVVIKARYRTKPLEQWNVGREMKRRIKKKFDETGIEIPFPHVSFYFGEASKPLKIDTNSREQMREVVQEFMEQRT